MTSRRYQSQFFNFVARQTQKFVDSSTTLLRHAKTTAIWTTQILLYPIYATFQGTRAIGRQIGQTVEKAVLRLRISREKIVIDPDTNLSDAPIQNVLTAVKRALVSGGNLPALRERHPLALVGRFWLQRSKEDLAATNPYQIQAIASDITTQRIVLILEDNVIFDILTPEQQQQIEHRIRLELARYWQWRRKLYLKSAPLALPDDRETLLPPIRVFRQLMAWIQSSPIAIALNLFQEAELTPPAELSWFIPNVPLAAWNPGTLIPQVPNPRNITAWFAQLPNFSDFEALIWAAIRYFFGARPQFASAQGELPGSVESSIKLNFKDWLSEKLSGRDVRSIGTQETLILEGTSTGFGAARSFSFTPPITPSITQTLREFLRKLSGAIVLRRKTTIVQSKEIVIRTRSQAVSTRIESEEFTAVIRTQLEPEPLTTTLSQAATVRSSQLTKDQMTEVQTAFDWIETPATHVKYVLTPWQTFLKWLDSGVLWLEQKLIALWRRLDRRH